MLFVQWISSKYQFYTFFVCFVLPDRKTNPWPAALIYKKELRNIQSNNTRYFQIKSKFDIIEQK